MHHDSGKLVIFALFLLGAILNILFKKGGLLNQPPRPPRPAAKPAAARPAPTPSRTVEDQRMRKLLEALGVPATDIPPAARPQLRAQPVIPPFGGPGSRPAASPPPARPAPSPATTRPPAPPPVTIFVPQPVVPSRVPANTSIRGPAAGKASTVRGDQRLRDLLSTSGGLRKAVVLKEVLGPPLGLRADEPLLY